MSGSQAVIINSPGPTIASRAYGMMHTAMYDAWSSYEHTPISTNLADELQRPDGENTPENKTEAMSYAAYRVLANLFPEQQQDFAQLMLDLGYDPDLRSPDPNTPAYIGNAHAEALIASRLQDGANQQGNINFGNPYSDYTGYESVNEPGHTTVIDRWTPDIIADDDLKSFKIQDFLTPHWGRVNPFALNLGAQFRPEPPQPFLLVDGQVSLQEKTITLEDDSVVKITPELVGSVINPEFIEQAEEVVEYSANLTSEQKLIAEFWEDGGGTSFPPGTWMTFGEYVSQRDDRTLNEDAQMFFALGNAMLDAGIVTWESKVHYDYARPFSTIRELGKLGLIGEYSQELGGQVIRAYDSQSKTTQEILVQDFITYQTPGADYSPPFAEYTSGHSAFSAAGAEILKQFTGDDYFGASVTFEPGTSRFEPGITPEQDTLLSWDTFSEAADQAGISRLYGGIHFDEGDLNGRTLGRQVGEAVSDRAQYYINGGETQIGEQVISGISFDLDIELNSDRLGTINISGISGSVSDFDSLQDLLQEFGHLAEAF